MNSVLLSKTEDLGQPHHIIFRQNKDLMWKFFILLLCVALGTEFIDKNPLAITGSIYIPYFRFNLISFIIFYFSILLLLIRKIDLSFPSVLKPVIVFWIVNQISLFGLIWAGLDSVKLQQFIKTDLNLSFYIIFVSIFLKFVTWQRLQFLINTYFSLGVISLVISLFQYVHGNYGWFQWMSDYVFASSTSNKILGFRSASLYGEASWAARYFVHWIALSLALYAYSKKNIYFIASILFLLAFFTAGSLSGILILFSFFGILIYKVMKGKIKLSFGTPKIAIIVIFFIGASAAIFSNPLFSPTRIIAIFRRVGLVLQGVDSSAFVRFDSTIAAIKVWIQSPIFGVGIGNLRFYMEQYFTYEFTFIRSFLTADSYYAIVLAECGIIGVLGFFYLIFKLTKNDNFSYKIIKSKFGVNGYKQRFFLLSILQIDLIAQTIGLIGYADVLSPHYWFVITIILSLQKLNR